MFGYTLAVSIHLCISVMGRERAHGPFGDPAGRGSGRLENAGNDLVLAGASGSPFSMTPIPITLWTGRADQWQEL